ncbi:MAG: GntR family transcriptional regulator [Polyangiaceae bacterium]
MARRVAAAATADASTPDPPARHAADAVFEQLASAIVNGHVPPGSSLPSERELSERFSVSRLVVRQAIHRLADMGLVRVRQGGPTQVVNPNDARDLRVIDLIYRLGQGSPRDMREIIERQLLHGYSLLYLASKRASRERLRSLARMAEEYADRGAPVAEMGEFEQRFFTAVAEATDNRFYQLETSWWFRMLAGRPPRQAVFDDAQRAVFYREIARRLVEDGNPAKYYLEFLSPVLDMLASFAFGPASTPPSTPQT